MDAVTPRLQPRLVELTDGQTSKPFKLDPSICTIDSLLKEGKNKFRKMYKHVIYKATRSDQSDQLVTKNEDLRRILHGHEGNLIFLLTSKSIEDDEGSAKSPLIVSKAVRGISYIIGDANYTEENAANQLKHASELRGCVFAIGMPDLHKGKGIPIGAVVMTNEEVAYPQLVDNDIGCGMSFVQTSLQGGKLSVNKMRKIANSLDSIDCPFATDGELIEMCSNGTEWAHWNLDPLPDLEPLHYKTLGTVGGGNHFAELQEFQDIIDPETIKSHGIDTQKIHLLVHSGSRSLGSHYLKSFCEKAAEITAEEGSPPKHGHFAADTSSALFQEYLHNHNVALNFAIRNRQLISRRLLEQITGETEPICKIDIHHNFMEPVELTCWDAIKNMAEQGQFPKEVPGVSNENVDEGSKIKGWIHRKGATPTNQSPILVIPGSRGSLSYLVEVNKSAQHGSGYSLAHGAGRKMARSKALKFHQGQYPNAQQLLQTDLGGIVVCEKKELVYEEAPTSYKDVDGVVNCLAKDIATVDGRGLVRILATLRPVLTYKYKDPYDR